MCDLDQQVVRLPREGSLWCISYAHPMACCIHVTGMCLNAMNQRRSNSWLRCPSNGRKHRLKCWYHCRRWTLFIQTERHVHVFALRIKGVLGSNLGTKAGYPDWRSYWVFLVPPGKYRASSLKQVTTASFHTLLNSLFILSWTLLLGDDELASGYYNTKPTDATNIFGTRSIKQLSLTIASRSPCSSQLLIS
jgi:hypothetical protein